MIEMKQEHARRQSTTAWFRPSAVLAPGTSHGYRRLERGSTTRSSARRKLCSVRADVLDLTNLLYGCRRQHKKDKLAIIFQAGLDFFPGGPIATAPRRTGHGARPEPEDRHIMKVLIPGLLAVFVFCAGYWAYDRPHGGSISVDTHTTDTIQDSRPQEATRVAPVTASPDGTDQLAETDHNLIRKADELTIAKLRPSAEFYFAKRIDRQYIRDYEIVAFSEDLLREIRNGEIREFTFSFKGDRVAIDVVEVLEHDSFWYMWGTARQYPGSIAEFSIKDDGSKKGIISLPGKGGYVMRTFAELPYHLVYFTTGKRVSDR